MAPQQRPNAASSSSHAVAAAANQPPPSNTPQSYSGARPVTTSPQSYSWAQTIQDTHSPTNYVDSDEDEDDPSDSNNNNENNGCDRTGHTPRVLHSHSSSFEADDERSATGGPRSFPSTATNSIREGGAATSSSLLPRHRRQSDSSSDYHPSQPYHNVYRMATGDDGGDDSHRRSSRSIRRRGRHAGPGAVAAYAGEDNRPTSNKEILGWYMYSFASETYVICGESGFFPLFLFFF